MGPAVRVAFVLVEWWFSRKKQDAESREIFLNLAKKLRETGVKGVRSRYESDQQLSEGDAEWDRREKEEGQNEKPT